MMRRLRLVPRKGGPGIICQQPPATMFVPSPAAKSVPPPAARFIEYRLFILCKGCFSALCKKAVFFIKEVLILNKDTELFVVRTQQTCV